MICTKLRWIDYIMAAMHACGGKACYAHLYREIKRLRKLNFTREWEATVRRTIETHSSDSENFRKGSNTRDIFYSVYGINRGMWGLREEYREQAREIYELLTKSRSF